METNELRIGNWVLTPDGSVQITDIFNGGINLSDDKYEAYPEYSMDRVSPIPLTESILEAAGFENGKIDFQYDVLEIEDGNAFLYNEYEGGGSYCFPCQYLHQLQNLYHALTGTELKVSLTEKVNV
jgi:ribosome biogenesis SPOUT family RNA methylase Rps3